MSNAFLWRGQGFAPAASTITQNLVWPDSHMQSIYIRSDESMTIPPWTFWPDCPADADAFKVTVEGQTVVEKNAALEFQIGSFYNFCGDGGYVPAWTKLTFQTGAPVSLAGTLRFYDYDLGGFPTHRLDPVFDLFDWPSESGTQQRFSNIELPAGAWDISELYSTGVIELLAFYGGDGDFADFLILSRNYGWKATSAESSSLLAAEQTSEDRLGDAALVALALATEQAGPSYELADHGGGGNRRLNEWVPAAVDQQNLTDTVFADGDGDL